MTLPTADYTGRLSTVQARLQSQNLDGLLVLGPANRRYLTGFTAADTAIGESAGFVLVMSDRSVLLVSPLYIDQARHESVVAGPVELRSPFMEQLADRLREWGLTRIAFERDYTLYGFYEDLRAKLAETVELVPVKDMVEPMRLRKDEAELGLMREAARIADEAFVRVTSDLQPGVTERMLARRLDEVMLELGAEAASFETIVAAGANSARPHHEPGDTPLNEGDPVVVDMGARYQGYCSDMTRSFCLRRADERYSELYELVSQAHDLAK
ncbi:MAG: Xaa-Pro peptidase family protein, partial [Chloroflexota bacterium]|nr:Xaa-Pro peptidase family protein [Chloroflexota bacterium]